MKRKAQMYLLLSIVIVSMLVIAGCGGGGSSGGGGGVSSGGGSGGGGGVTPSPSPSPSPAPGPPPTLTSLQITPANPSLAAGLTQQMTATGIFSDNSTQDLTSSVTWSSSDPNVATVSATGLVTTIIAGSVSISASGQGQTAVTGTMAMTVTNATLAQVAIDQAAPTCARDTEVQLTMTAILSDNTTQDVTEQATWTSSNEAVAEVSDQPGKKGKVSGVGGGTATITAELPVPAAAKAQGSGKIAQTNLTVTGASVVAMRIDQPADVIARGTSYQFACLARYADGTQQDVTNIVSWSSSNPSFATVSATGLVTAIGPGLVDITARFPGSNISISGALAVTSAYLMEFKFFPASLSIAQGTSGKLLVAGEFSDNTLQNATDLLTWTSSNPLVATVSNAAGEKGIITGVSAGSAVISAENPGSLHAPASMNVTVTSATLQSITVNPPDTSNFQHETLQMRAVGAFSDSSTQDITDLATWTSSTPGIASISNAAGSRGLVTGVSPGTAVITATFPGTVISGNTSYIVAAPPAVGAIPAPNLDPQPYKDVDFIQDRAAAIQLGKALFWDMQVGSDGIQACGSCHFHAGADSRVKNQVTPGFDNTFQMPEAGPGPNKTITAAENHSFSQVRALNDLLSSQGVVLRQFVGIVPGQAEEQFSAIPDPVFNIGGVNTRRVEPLNTPTMINASNNFHNFWNGRANFYFNGENPFGTTDMHAGVWVNYNGTLYKAPVRIVESSLASQAVGPPMSDFEMSYRGRTFPQLGKKMLSLPVPIGKQLVDPTDSVLGTLSRAPLPGINGTYADMIQAAFRPQYWNSTGAIEFPRENAVIQAPTKDDPRTYTLSAGQGKVLKTAPRALSRVQYTQMEANFALFFGLAVQAYEETLISDQSPYDLFVRGDNNALTASQKAGLQNFRTFASCTICHIEPEFTDASVTNTSLAGPLDLMAVVSGELAFYDQGFQNIAVRPTVENLNRGGDDPFGYPLAWSRLAILNTLGQLPLDISIFTPFLDVFGFPPGIHLTTTSVNGTFKTPTLRNVELTGPYMHTGGIFTLTGITDFYEIHGFFPTDNVTDFNPEINLITNITALTQVDLVNFLMSLTDPRVKNEAAPFDHPEITVPNGHDDTAIPDPVNGYPDQLLTIPASGAAGHPLTPLGTFLNLDPQTP